MLSCSFPRRPDYGDVTVMDLHSGGVAHFHCHLGYELQGAKTLTCINASKPHWSSHEPICSGTRQPRLDQQGWLRRRGETNAQGIKTDLRKRLSPGGEIAPNADDRCHLQLHYVINDTSRELYH